MTPFFRILTFIPFNRQINPSTKIILNFVINKKIIIPNFRVLKYFGMLLRIRIAKNSFLLLHDVRRCVKISGKFQFKLSIVLLVKRILVWTFLQDFKGWMLKCRTLYQKIWAQLVYFITNYNWAEILSSTVFIPARLSVR